MMSVHQRFLRGLKTSEASFPWHEQQPIAAVERGRGESESARLPPLPEAVPDSCETAEEGECSLTNSRGVP
eukprot:scaffold65557_cov32-Tisochrysis_lutea.AAC.1